MKAEATFLLLGLQPLLIGFLFGFQYQEGFQLPEQLCSQNVASALLQPSFGLILLLPLAFCSSHPSRCCPVGPNHTASRVGLFWVRPAGFGDSGLLRLISRQPADHLAHHSLHCFLLLQVYLAPTAKISKQNFLPDIALFFFNSSNLPYPLGVFGIFFF